MAKIKKHFSDEVASWPIESILAHPWVHMVVVHTYECPATKWGSKTKGHMHGPCNCGAAAVGARLEAYKLELVAHPKPVGEASNPGRE